MPRVQVASVIKVVRRSRLVFPLAVLAVLAMLMLSEASQRRSMQTMGEIGTMIEMRGTVRELQQVMVDAEAAQRGAMLTDRKEYRATYEQAVQRAAAAFLVLDRYFQDKRESRELLQQLHRVAEAKLSELELTLRLKDEGRGAASTEIIASGIGKEQLDEMRRLSIAIRDVETSSIARSQNEVYRTLLISRIGIALLSLIGLVAMYLYLRQTTALERQQQEQQRLLQQERDGLELEVAHRTTDLTELAQHLQRAREDERGRLARNLHDDLGALLTAAKLDAARIRSRLAETAPEAQELLKHLVTTLNESIALGRRIIEDLRPSALGNLGLTATLEILVREFATRSGTQVHLALERVELTPGSELIVYRLVQEAITNIVKYARANNVWVELETVDGQARVTVRDDGAGFDQRAKPTLAYGLLGMRFRVEAAGGTLVVESAPAQGTRIIGSLPLQELHERAARLE